ncbi:MAG: hypothetical protein LUE17_12895 [Planctomycetaceae bacterium]|nr:hypothetical protein [Planctomycetaceae bacterium]
MADIDGGIERSAAFGIDIAKERFRPVERPRRLVGRIHLFTAQADPAVVPGKGGEFGVFVDDHGRRFGVPVRILQHFLLQGVEGKADIRVQSSGVCDQGLEPLFLEFFPHAWVGMGQAGCPVGLVAGEKASDLHPVFFFAPLHFLDPIVPIGCGREERIHFIVGARFNAGRSQFPDKRHPLGRRYPALDGKAIVHGQVKARRVQGNLLLLRVGGAEQAFERLFRPRT